MGLICGCDDGDYPEVFRVYFRVARKVHRCKDCQKEIQPGEEYEYTFSVFEGEASSSKTCMACAGIGESLADLGFCFEEGGLRQAYIEYLDNYAPHAVRYDEEKDEYQYPRNHLTVGKVPTYDPKAPV